MQEEIIRTRYGGRLLSTAARCSDDPAENARRKKELYHICVRAIMNLPPDRRAIYDVSIRRKYGEGKQ